MDQKVQQLNQPVPKGTDTLGWGRAFVLREKPDISGRIEREGSGKEKDVTGRRVRFGVCCTSEIHSFLRPEWNQFTS